MKSNGPTRRDKFAEAWAKLEDITKKENQERREERGAKGGGNACGWFA